MVTTKQASKTTWAIVLILIGILAIYAFLCATVKVEIADSSIRVNGMYGTVIEYSEITSVQRIDELPIMGTRTNGIGLGFMNVGHYSYPDIGRVVLYQMKTEKPYILVKTTDKQVIYGFGSVKNEEIYLKIMETKKAHK